MSIINRRNAVLGYATWKVLERRRKQKQRSAAKLALYLGLGIVSAGVLAGLVALLVRRHRAEPEQQDYDSSAEEATDNIQDQVTASAEPVPAT